MVVFTLSNYLVSIFNSTLSGCNDPRKALSSSGTDLAESPRKPHLNSVPLLPHLIVAKHCSLDCKLSLTSLINETPLEI